MKLSPDQLTYHLAHHLLPVYCISGDEPLLMDEACQQIRTTAYQKGFQNREICHITPKFKWENFWQSAQNLSLFSEQTVLEIRSPSDKLKENGKKYLLEYLTRPPEDKILLIIMPKLTPATQKTKWFKTLQQTGAHLPIWPVQRGRLPQWIKHRFQQVNVQIDDATLAFIADNSEGNLLAASQMIEKLTLLHDKPQLTMEDVMSSMHDSTHFDVFELADSILSGEAKRSLKILSALAGSGTEPTLILWAITREIRTLLKLQTKIAEGISPDQAFKMYFIWDKRKPYFRAALKRLDLHSLLQLLQCAGTIDRMIKGVEKGHVWTQFNHLILLFTNPDIA